jgi:DNA-3-methyladenine glycosylase I
VKAHALAIASIQELRERAVMNKRCEWCGSDPLDVAYHDGEWGVPVHDDRRLFEFLVLEGAQAGAMSPLKMRRRAL